MACGSFRQHRFDGGEAFGFEAIGGEAGHDLFPWVF
jgi:hypothetical protein